jgi:magnesium transporter
VGGLSFNHNSLWRLILGELGTGLLIGLCLGALALPIVWFGFGNLGLAAAVALAILAAGAAATSIGLLLPWLLSRLGFDPAFGSGPVATIIQDVLSLLVYFGLAVALVL